MPTSSSPDRSAPHRPPRWPWLLLALMTVSAFGGPFLIWFVLRGGDQPGWPPDRFIEWVVFSAVVALVLTLLAAALILGQINRQELAARRHSGSPLETPYSQTS